LIVNFKVQKLRQNIELIKETLITDLSTTEDW